MALLTIAQIYIVQSSTKRQEFVRTVTSKWNFHSFDRSKFPKFPPVHLNICRLIRRDSFIFHKNNVSLTLHNSFVILKTHRYCVLRDLLLCDHLTSCKQWRPFWFISRSISHGLVSLLCNFPSILLVY